eukprot:Gb_00702 [translate_table: standard]
MSTGHDKDSDNYIRNMNTISDSHDVGSRKRLKFWIGAGVVLLLALGFGIVIKDPSRIPLLNVAVMGFSPWPIVVDIVYKGLGFVRTKESTPGPVLPYWVLWMAPFLSGGGYSSEAWSYVAALEATKSIPRLRILQHGDLESLQFWAGLPDDTKALALKLYGGNFQLNETVVICHSEPGAWYPPLFETTPCPPSGYDEPLYVIGRTMFETDRVNPEHVKRCNKMDSVWVPTDFHVKTFIRSGILPSKVVKMVQSVDVDFFNPDIWQPLSLPAERRLFGPMLSDKVKFLPRDAFIFLSIFKWEWRKGWDVLLKAYLQEFSAEDNVVLYILTNPYHTDRNFDGKLTYFVKNSGLQEPLQGWPAVHLSDAHIPQYDLPRLYKAAAAFVLPSRGEGWGRPHVEAMAMSLPIIATNWSGPTEYLTEDNSYPLPLDGMSEVMEGPFQGHFWAEPSPHKLRQLMRRVFSNPKEARSKGIQARQDMVMQFSPAVVAKQEFYQGSFSGAFLENPRNHFVNLLTRFFFSLNRKNYRIVPWRPQSNTFSGISDPMEVKQGGWQETLEYFCEFMEILLFRKALLSS